jgi:L-2,4-diaminobutyrate decarboxylase
MPVDPFAPEDFRALGHRWIDQLADHLHETATRSGPVLRWQEPEAALAAVPPLDGRGGADALQFVRDLCDHSNRLHHPRFVGHQVSAPLPLAVLLDAVTALLNNGMAVYEMGPLSTMMELRALDWLAQKFGLPATAGGVMTSGGSVGNLTALLAARQLRSADDAWQHGAGRGTVFASSQAHYSVDRAVHILGLGSTSSVWARRVV